MRKTKDYKLLRFHPRVYRKAIEACRSYATKPEEDREEASTQIDGESWRFDNLEEYFNSLISSNIRSSTLSLYWDGVSLVLQVSFFTDTTQVSVSNSNRHVIEAVFSIFEEAASEDRILIADHDAKQVEESKEEDVRIFIGHGRNPQWEKLKAHLQDKHELDVVCYETGARAGHTIRDILDSMAEDSSFALLVLTGEDKTEDGLRARQNVIHECGLFQGRLGFDRAVLIVEDGVQLASNFDGIQQLRFKRGRISEIFGDVIATIRREFGPV